MLSNLLYIFKLFGMLFEFFKQRQERSLGAELQRGKDSQDELVRVTKAVNAGNDPTLVDDSLLATDKNNRANKRKGGAKTSSV